MCGGGRRPGLRALGFRPPLLEVDVLQVAEDDREGRAVEGETGELDERPWRDSLGPLAGRGR